uniref:Uncharacterized protein n=1 Tax=Steinernema glaseri TaxID=37863 RepID=A0A1I8A0E6_9BILA
MSSNVYFGDMMVPGPHMFALLFPYRNKIYEEVHTGNRLWDSNGQAQDMVHRQNNDPSFIEGPHGGIIAKKKQGYITPGAEYDPVEEQQVEEHPEKNIVKSSVNMCFRP